MEAGRKKREIKLILAVVCPIRRRDNPPMKTIWLYISAHQATSTLLAYMIFSNFVGSMPSPQANSTTAYRWIFSFLNAMASNLTRAISQKIEASPNFQQAVNIQTAQAGLPPITVQPVPERTDTPAKAMKG
jgi:hypothetical protein